MAPRAAKPAMNWNAEANEKLLVGIVQVYGIQVSGDNLKKLNEYMGLDPNSQSIQHQLRKLKSLNTTVSAAGDAPQNNNTTVPELTSPTKRGRPRVTDEDAPRKRHRGPVTPRKKKPLASPELSDAGFDYSTALEDQIPELDLNDGAA